MTVLHHRAWKEGKLKKFVEGKLRGFILYFKRNDRVRKKRSGSIEKGGGLVMEEKFLKIGEGEAYIGK